MNKLGNWIANSPLGGALKAALGVVLSMILVETTSGGIDFANWQTWLYAALGAALPVIINALNRSDSRYGVKAGK
jgi:hypothetical protein